MICIKVCTQNGNASVVWFSVIKKGTFFVGAVMQDLCVKGAVSFGYGDREEKVDTCSRYQLPSWAHLQILEPGYPEEV